jgi:hypothetical protein
VFESFQIRIYLTNKNVTAAKEAERDIGEQLAKVKVVPAC